MMRRTLVAMVVAVLFLVWAGLAGATFPGANGRIAYMANDGLHTVLPSGHGDRLIAQSVGSPSWSPDGKRIAVTRSVGPTRQSEIYSIAADGSDRRRLTHSRFDDFRPSYSPNGNRIVFTENRQADPVIMTIRADGSRPRSLGDGGSAVWSPHGEWIAYGRISASGIWAMHPNGTDKHRIIEVGRSANGGAIGGYSPDGSQITFARCGDRCRAFVANSDGSSVRRLPCPADYFRGVTAPSYSPDGRRLLGETGGVDVVTLPLNSCSPRVVRSLSPDDAALPAWQPLPAS